MSVPLAWKNVTADKHRLTSSTLGIAFAVLLMLIQLGFRNALVDSQVAVVRRFDADAVIVSAAKFQLNVIKPFPRRRLYQALSVDGVVSVTPVYMALPDAHWKNPRDHTLHRIRVLGVDPDERTFRVPEIASQIRTLRTPDTILLDTRCKDHLGRAFQGEVSELTQRKVQVVGEFSLGSDFIVDGTAIASDRTFFNLFFDYRSTHPHLSRVEIGLVQALPGFSLDDLVEDLERMLPADVVCLTRDKFIELERNYWLYQSPVGLVFGLGTLVGFIVGVVICSQILFSEISEKMPQFATLKAIGYENHSLRKVVLQQATFLALLGYIPGVAASWCLYQIVEELTSLPMRMEAGLAVTVLALTLAMCFLSGLMAVQKVLRADPADVF